jgi:hypothetical protein
MGMADRSPPLLEIITLYGRLFTTVKRTEGLDYKRGSHLEALALQVGAVSSPQPVVSPALVAAVAENLRQKF